MLLSAANVQRMHRIPPERRAPRCVVSVVAMLGMVVGMLVVSAPSSGAVKKNTCRARNLTQGTP